MDTSKPLTVAIRTSFRETPWMTRPSIPATTVESSITGMVGFRSRDPARTMATGTSSRIFQWYMASSWASMVVTVSEVTSAVISVFRPAMAYTIRETMLAGMVV